MEDEKSIAEKLTGVISKAADTVKHAVSHVVESASEAAQHAMEANAEKISRIPPARPDPGKVAGTTNEQVYIPETSDAAAMPMPLFPPAVTPKKQKSVARRAPAGKTPAKQAARRAKTKTKAAKKPTARRARKAAKRPPAKKAGKAAKKSAVRKPKKTRRKSAR